MTSVAILGAGAWGTALAIHLAERAQRRSPRSRCGRAMPGRRASLARHASTRATFRASRCRPRSPSRRTCVEAARAELLCRNAGGGIARPRAGTRRARRARAARLAGKGIRRRTRIARGRRSRAPGDRAGRGRRPWASRRARRSRKKSRADCRQRSRWRRRSRDSRRTVAALLRGETLRTYESDDLAGVEIGGAIKNVLAIAAGALDGLGVRPQRARRADHARTGRNRTAVRGTRRKARNADGARGPGRSRADLHGRPVAQPPCRIGARAGEAAARDPGRIGPRCGRCHRGGRRARAAPRITASRCRSASAVVSRPARGPSGATRRGSAAAARAARSEERN